MMFERSGFAEALLRSSTAFWKKQAWACASIRLEASRSPSEERSKVRAPRIWPPISDTASKAPAACMKSLQAALRPSTEPWSIVAPCEAALAPMLNRMEARSNLRLLSVACRSPRQASDHVNETVHDVSLTGK